MGGAATGGKRVQRNYVQPIVDMFLMNNQFPTIPYLICGSYRRVRPSCGDVEITFNVNTNDVKFYELRAVIIKVFGRTLAGEPKMQGIYAEVQFDLFIATDLQLGAMLLHTTGNGLFNIMMRRRAMMFGLKLNQYGLWRGEDVVVQGSDEERFFQALSMNYIKPEDRSIT